MAERNATYPHAMLREICEQPEALRRTLERYATKGALRMEAFGAAVYLLAAHDELLIAASGSSRHAGLAAEVMLEDEAGLLVDVEYASEFVTRPAAARAEAPVLVISQSGETADTLAALRVAHDRGHATMAITNVSDSSMAQEAAIPLPTLAGVEAAIPATKSFTTQLLVLRLLSLLSGAVRGRLSDHEIADVLGELQRLPEIIEGQLQGWMSASEALAQRYADAQTLLYLGRGVHYAIAREGALKLKESSYIHAEGYPSGELKHGPNALVSEALPLVVLATVDRADAGSVLRYEKTVSLLGDLRTQGARVLAVAIAGDDEVRRLASDVIEVAPLHEMLLPMAEVIPLQMFAYQMALARGVDVDRPRNLVKSVVRE